MTSIQYTTPLSQQYAPTAISTCHKVVKFLQEGPRSPVSQTSHTTSASDLATIEMIQTLIAQLSKPTCSIEIVARAYYNLALTFNNKGQTKESASLSKSALKLYADHTVDHQRAFLSAQLYTRALVSSFQSKINQVQETYQHLQAQQSHSSQHSAQLQTYLSQQQPDVMLRALLDVFWTIWTVLKVFIKQYTSAHAAPPSPTSTTLVYQLKLYIHWIMHEIIMIVLKMFELIKELSAIAYFQPSHFSNHTLISPYTSIIANRLQSDPNQAIKHSIPITLPINPPTPPSLPQIVLPTLHFQLIHVLITISTHLIVFHPIANDFLFQTNPTLHTLLQSASSSQHGLQQLYNFTAQLTGSQLTVFTLLIVLAYQLDFLNDPLIISLQYYSQSTHQTTPQCSDTTVERQKGKKSVNISESESISASITTNTYLSYSTFYELYRDHELVIPDVHEVNTLLTNDKTAHLLTIFTPSNISLSTMLVLSMMNTFAITLSGNLTTLQLSHFCSDTQFSLTTLMTTAYFYFIALTTPCSTTSLSTCIETFVNQTGLATGQSRMEATSIPTKPTKCRPTKAVTPSADPEEPTPPTSSLPRTSSPSIIKALSATQLLDRIVDQFCLHAFQIDQYHQYYTYLISLLLNLSNLTSATLNQYHNSQRLLYIAYVLLRPIFTTIGLAISPTTTNDLNYFSTLSPSTPPSAQADFDDDNDESSSVPRLTTEFTTTPLILAASHIFTVVSIYPSTPFSELTRLAQIESPPDSNQKVQPQQQQSSLHNPIQWLLWLWLQQFATTTINLSLNQAITSNPSHLTSPSSLHHATSQSQSDHPIALKPKGRAKKGVDEPAEQTKPIHKALSPQPQLSPSLEFELCFAYSISKAVAELSDWKSEQSQGQNKPQKQPPFQKYLSCSFKLLCNQVSTTLLSQQVFHLIDVHPTHPFRVHSNSDHSSLPNSHPHSPQPAQLSYNPILTTTKEIINQLTHLLTSIQADKTILTFQKESLSPAALSKLADKDNKIAKEMLDFSNAPGANLTLRDLASHHCWLMTADLLLNTTPLYSDGYIPQSNQDSTPTNPEASTTLQTNDKAQHLVFFPSRSHPLFGPINVNPFSYQDSPYLIEYSLYPHHTDPAFEKHTSTSPYQHLTIAQKQSMGIATPGLDQTTQDNSPNSCTNSSSLVQPQLNLPPATLSSSSPTFSTSFTYTTIQKLYDTGSFSPKITPFLQPNNNTSLFQINPHFTTTSLDHFFHAVIHSSSSLLSSAYQLISTVYLNGNELPKGLGYLSHSLLLTRRTSNIPQYFSTLLKVFELVLSQHQLQVSTGFVAKGQDDDFFMTASTELLYTTLFRVFSTFCKINSVSLQMRYISSTNRSKVKTQLTTQLIQMLLIIHYLFNQTSIDSQPHDITNRNISQFSTQDLHFRYLITLASVILLQQLLPVCDFNSIDIQPQPTPTTKASKLKKNVKDVPQSALSSQLISTPPTLHTSLQTFTTVAVETNSQPDDLFDQPTVGPINLLFSQSDLAVIPHRCTDIEANCSLSSLFSQIQTNTSHPTPVTKPPTKKAPLKALRSQPSNNRNDSALLLTSLVKYLSNPSKFQYSQLSKLTASTILQGPSKGKRVESSTSQPQELAAMVARIPKTLLFSTLTKYTEQLATSLLLSKPSLNSIHQVQSTPPPASLLANHIFSTILHMLSLNQSYRIQKDLYLDDSSNQHGTSQIDSPNYVAKSLVSFGPHFLSDLAQLLGFEYAVPPVQTKFTCPEQPGDENEGDNTDHSTIFTKVLSKIQNSSSYELQSGPGGQVKQIVANTNEKLSSLFDILPSWLQVVAVSIQDNSPSPSTMPTSNAQNLPSLCISIISPLNTCHKSSSTDRSTPRSFTTFLLPLLSLPSQSNHGTVSIWTQLQNQWYYLHHVNTLHNTNTKYLSSSAPTIATLTPHHAAKLWWSHAFRIEYAMLSYLIHVERTLFGPFAGLLRPPVTCSHARSLINHYSHSFLNTFVLLLCNTASTPPSNPTSVSAPKQRSCKKSPVVEESSHPNAEMMQHFSTDQQQLLAGLINTIMFSPLYKNTGGLSFSYHNPQTAEGPANAGTPAQRGSKSSKSSQLPPPPSQPPQQQQVDDYQPLPGPFSPVAALLYIAGFISTPYVTLRHITSLLRYIHLKQTEMIENDAEFDLFSILADSLSQVTEINQNRSILPIDPYSSCYIFNQHSTEADDADWSEYRHSQASEVRFLTHFLSSISPSPSTNPICYDFISSNSMLRGVDLDDCGETPADHHDNAVMTEEQFHCFLLNSISIAPISQAQIVSATNSTINALHKDSANSRPLPQLFDPFSALPTSSTTKSVMLVDRIYVFLTQFSILIQTLQGIYLCPDLTCAMNSNFSTHPLTLLLSKDLMNIPWESLPIMRWCDFTVPTNSPYSLPKPAASRPAAKSTKTQPQSEQMQDLPDAFANIVDPLRLPLEDTAVDLFHLAMEQQQTSHAATPTARKRGEKSSKESDSSTILLDDSDNDNDACDDTDSAIAGETGKIAKPSTKLDDSPTASNHFRFRSRCVIKPQRITRILSLHHLYCTHFNLLEKRHNGQNQTGKSDSNSTSNSSSMTQLTPSEWDTMYQSLGTVCDPRQSVFQLDPSNDLPKTQQKFKYFFKDVLRLKGEVGKPFNITTLHKAFEYCHMYIYAGHNNGQQFYKYNDIAKLCSKTGSKIVTVAWLLGCSSAKFELPSLSQYVHPLPSLEQVSSISSKLSTKSTLSTDPGLQQRPTAAITDDNHTAIIQFQRDQVGKTFSVPTTFNVFEPHGSVLGYILAGVPCVVGNLWNVTDQDIDKQTKIFCEQIFNERYQLQPPSDSQPPRTSQSLPLCASVLSKVDLCGHDYGVERKSVASSTNSIHSCDISSLLFSSRQSCLLPYVNGGAMVIYGAHIRTDKPTKSRTR